MKRGDPMKVRKPVVLLREGPTIIWDEGPLRCSGCGMHKGCVIIMPDDAAILVALCESCVDGATEAILGATVVRPRGPRLSRAVPAAKTPMLVPSIGDRQLRPKQAQLTRLSAPRKRGRK